MIILPSINRALKGLKRVIDGDGIEFYCTPELFDVIPHPVPAYKRMAPWFKGLKPVVTDGGRDQIGGKGLTAKRCMPMLDAMSAGWIIPLYADVNVIVNEEGTLIHMADNPLGKVIDRHPISQAGAHSPSGELDVVKFINPWIIRTPEGVSTIFVPPVNHFDKRFTAFTGLVDTDRYAKQVNFPAVWHLRDYDDILPAGTPVVTAIPVRRSDLGIEPTIRKINKKEAEEVETEARKTVSRRGVYANEVRDPRK